MSSISSDKCSYKDQSQSSTEYEVEKIIGHKIKKKKDKRTKKFYYQKEYLVKWVGYTKPTWEPESNLDNCQELLNEYKLKILSKKSKDNSENTYNIYSNYNESSSEENYYIPKKKYRKHKVSKSVFKAPVKKKSVSQNTNKTSSLTKMNKNPLYSNKNSLHKKSKTADKNNYVYKHEKNKCPSSKIKNEIEMPENNDKNQYNSNIKENYINMPIYSNAFNKLILSNDYDFGPLFRDIMKGDKTIKKDNGKNFGEVTFSSKKRNKCDSLCSSYTIQLEDSKNIESNDQDMSVSDIDGKQNNKSIDFIEINEVKVPSNIDENISILGKFNINGKIVDVSGTRNLGIFPKEEIFKYYEHIIKYYHGGKILKFQ